jgi:hypothetical protein
MPPEPSLEGFPFESSAIHAASHALYIKPIWPLEVEGLWREVSYAFLLEKGREKKKKARR